MNGLGRSLANDFRHLTRAVVVAASLKRRLVLPNRMNCNNCPALEAYKGTAMLGTSNCTFDYFAWSQSFLGHHGELVVESGLESDPHFALLSAETATSDHFVELFQAAWKGGHGGKGNFRSRRLHIADLELAYKTALEVGFRPAMVFECRHHDWPVGWMACRDQRFVQAQGMFSRCEAFPEQGGCGYRGVTCCEAFWGWSEKLEYFTGKSWDLPCNCGLSECEPREGAERAQGCCAFAGGQPRCDRRIRMESVPEINTPEDTESLTSTALAELEAFGDPISFWKTCRLNRQLRASDKTIEELLWNCHRLATRFLLLKQNLDVLGRWCRFAHRLRRAATDTADLAFPRNWPSPTLLRPFNAETGKVEVLRTEDLNLKLSHDLAQLGFLQQKFSRSEILEVVEGLRLLGNIKVFDSIYAGNRARFVPELKAEVNITIDPLVDSFSVTDGILNSSLVEALADWFAEATIWHAPHLQGQLLQASLLDGLNCEALMSVASGFKSQLRTLVLENMWAWKLNAMDTHPPVRVYSNSQFGAPDLLLLFWVSDGEESEGLELTRSKRRHFIQRRKNRVVLWGPEWIGALHFGRAQSEYRAKQVDLIMSFRKSFGHKLYPGWGVHALQWSGESA
ncbi:Hypothetical protein (Fragment) [Durusdinium trenchii]|uniref:Uncharacterized protein n=1 Tax=Durusdinium trenchii TaxID=1381693 RepID=A0ABP0LMJ8_9DINO